jgi:DNA invertase Pin-like site-specific DNA recombinase
MKSSKGQSKSKRPVVAVYVRVNPLRPDHLDQLPALERWVGDQGETVRWYHDTGAAAQFKQFRKLLSDVRAGRIAKLCVWRLDCLGEPGCTARDLIELVDDLLFHHVQLISLCEGLDLKTPRPSAR